MHHCQTQSCSNSGIHDIAPSNEQLLAQVGARGCSKEGTVMGRGLGPVTPAPPLSQAVPITDLQG